MSDSFLYKSVKNAVIKRADKIDVWFESPAVELIQDPDSRIVVGVKVTRNGETRNVRALGGVVVPKPPSNTFMCHRSAPTFWHILMPSPVLNWPPMTE